MRKRRWEKKWRRKEKPKKTKIWEAKKRMKEEKKRSRWESKQEDSPCLWSQIKREPQERASRLISAWIIPSVSLNNLTTTLGNWESFGHDDKHLLRTYISQRNEWLRTTCTQQTTAALASCWKCSELRAQSAAQIPAPSPISRPTTTSSSFFALQRCTLDRWHCTAHTVSKQQVEVILLTV